MRKTLDAGDLFCGAGGFSLGLRLICQQLGIKLNLLAVNHWPTAIATHSKNLPDVAHYCTNLDNVDPRKLVPSGKLDLLIASPECVHHSNARGGMPINDQSRASAWRLVEWASQIEIKEMLIENVPEFRSWGPLIKKRVTREIPVTYPFVSFEKWLAQTRRFGGTEAEWEKIYGELSKYERPDGKQKEKVTITVMRPDPKRKGAIYFSFLEALRAMGYTVEDRVLNAADFGGATSRARLFIRASLQKKRITWPEPTHIAIKPTAKPNPNSGRLFDISPTRKPYRTAREIIDWDIQGESIFTRKRPLRPNTMSRIFRGLEKFCGIPFIVPQEGDDRIRSIDRPLQTVKTQSRGIGLAEPYLVKYYGGQHSQSLDEPLPTVTANYEHYGLARPFVVLLRKGQDAQSIDEPLTTITTMGAHHGVARPYIVVLRNNADGQSLDDPLRTLTTGGNFGLAQPFILALEHGGSERSVDQPLNVITTAKGGAHALARPFIVPFFGERDGQKPRSHSVDDPLPTVTGQGAGALVQPFIIPTNHGDDGRSHDIDRPMPTVTSVDAWALIEPQINPYLVKYNGTGGAMSVAEPLDTITAKDRFALVEPLLQPGDQLALLDIHFRMLTPKELAAAMGFPKTYFFVGNREQQVKQIGNAVEVNMAQALFQSILA